MEHVNPAIKIFARHVLKYIALIVLCYAPWLFVIKYFASTGDLSSEADDAIAGILGIFFMPLCNGATVWMNHKHAERESITIKESLKVSISVWKDLLTAYISVGLIILGWVAVALIPGGLLMLLFGIKNALILIPFGVIAILFVTTRYVFLDFYVVLRKEPGWQARRNCVEMSTGRMWRLLFAYLFLAAPLFFSEFAFGYFGTYLEQATGVSKHLFEGLLSVLSTLLYVIPQIYFYLVYRDIAAGKD